MPVVQRSALALIVVATTALPRPSFGDSYYAGVQGCSDTGPGTAAQPFCTLSKAAAQLKPGDTLNLLAGTYAQQLLLPASASGTPDKHVVIQGASGATAVLDGKTVTLTSEQALLQGSKLSNIEIRNLTLRSSSFYCLRMERVSGLLIDGLIIDGCQRGGLVVDGPSDNVTVRKCDLKGAASCGAGCPVREDISLSNVVGFVVSGNTVHDGALKGIAARDGSGDGEIVGNEVYKKGDVGIYLNHAFHVSVHGNRVHDMGGDGIQLMVGDVAGGMPEVVFCEIFQNDLWKNVNGIWLGRTFVGVLSRNRIYNNTLVDNSASGIHAQYESANFIANNIVVGNKLHGIFLPMINADTITTNLFFQNGGGADEAMWDGAITGDPLFVDPTKPDYSLRKGSPAIGVGVFVGLTSTDLGAHPFGTTPGTPGSDGAPGNGASGGGGGCSMATGSTGALWMLVVSALLLLGARKARRDQRLD